MHTTSFPAGLAAVAIAVLLALVAPAPGYARQGPDDDVRVRGACGRGATSELRATARDGEIRVEFSVDSRRSGERWRVLVVHERRVAWRGMLLTRSSGAFRVRYSVPDFDGADQVSARASGPDGNTCQATGVLYSS